MIKKTRKLPNKHQDIKTHQFPPYNKIWIEKKKLIAAAKLSRKEISFAVEIVIESLRRRVI